MIKCNQEIEMRKLRLQSLDIEQQSNQHHHHHHHQQQHHHHQQQQQQQQANKHNYIELIRLKCVYIFIYLLISSI
ncbi:unnamed protein product [Schistosoma curassoni]|uniref:Uncharacterized protein n=1 Tax=Schistosoma curassoni TaxID=6186 RepID=A0A183JW56_9TREM|nr:unnamed protein product [Schistosoma curassoni]